MILESLYSTGLLLASDTAAPDPVLLLRVDLLLFSIIIFGVLLLVLHRFAWGPIMEGLDKREKSIADDVSNAQNANAQAQANLKQYEDRLAAVAEEATAILVEAKKDAVAAKERVMADAQEEATRIRDRAMAEIEAAKDAAVRELAEKSVDSAVSLAGNIVGRSLTKSDHSKLIEDSIKSFADGNSA